MSDHQPSTKNPHDLFREIDALCNEIDTAVPNGMQEIEFLLAHDFVTLSTGKVRLDREPREDEDRVFTWFILGKTDSLHPHKIKEG
jgi:hypothetical protein